MSLQWNHRILRDPFYISPWMAKTRALDLHFELHPQDFSVPFNGGVALGLSPPHFRSPQRSKVKFDDQVIVFEQDESMNFWTRTTVSLGERSQDWQDSVRHEDVDLVAIHDSPPHCELRPDPNEIPIVQFPGGLPPPDRTARGRRGVPHWPDWLYDLWNLFVRDSATEREDEGPVLYIRSQYLHHPRHQNNADIRPLRLDHDWTQWEADLRFMWEDLVDGSPLQVHIAFLQPEETPTPVILIAQGLFDGRRACLLTTIDSRSVPPRITETAHSLPVFVPVGQVLARAPRRHGSGRTFRGLQEHFTDEEIRTSHGLCITYRIPQEPRPESPGEDDETTLMSRPATPSSPSASSGESSYDSSSSTAPAAAQSDWFDTVIVGERGEWPTLSIPWNDRDVIYEIVGPHIGLRPEQIEYLHNVPHLPEDLLERQVRALLLQPRADIQSAPTPEGFWRLTLLDIEHYGRSSFSWPSLNRRSQWFPCTINRLSILRLLGFETACISAPDRCFVYLNGDLISASYVPPLQLVHGDYIQVSIPSDEVPSLCSSSSTSMLQEVDSDAFYEAVLAIPDSDDMSTLQTVIATTYKMLPEHEVPHGEVGKALPTAAILQQARTNRDLALDEIQDFCENQVTAAQHDEPFQFTFRTWYLSGLHRATCEHPRHIRLGQDPEHWYGQLCHLWQDHRDERQPLDIILVRATQPPGDIILYQHLHPLHRVVLVHTDEYETNLWRTKEKAVILPRWLSSRRLCQILGLQDLCNIDSSQCTISHNDALVSSRLPVFPLN